MDSIKLLGAVSDTGETFFLPCEENFNNDTTIRLLDALQTEFDEKICVVLDNASYFTANAVQEFVEETPIELCYLPRGSPELNPRRSAGRSSIKHSATACSTLWTTFVMPRSLRSTASIHQISPRTYVRKYEHAEELLWPESPIPLKQPHEHDVKDYAFPVERLQPAEDTSLAARHGGEDQETTEANDEIDTTSDADGLDEGESETTRESNEVSSTKDNGGESDLHELRDYLKDNRVRSKIDDGTVIVEKLGETYRLSTDEVVEGDGPYRDRLEQLVNDAPV